MSLALITGSSGHVGANLIRELTKQNYTITKGTHDIITNDMHPTLNNIHLLSIIN